MHSEEEYLQRLGNIREALNKVDFDQLEIKPEDLQDPFCDPDKPVIVDFEHISAAAYRVRGGIENTPCTVNDIF